MSTWFKKLYDRYRFFFYGVFGTAMVVVMLYAANYVAALFGKEDQWDSMAFIGSLLGGALTLIGVQMTINNQFKLEYSKKHPQFRRAADKLNQETGIIVNEVEFALEFDEYENLSISIKDYKEKESELLDACQEINAGAYEWTRDFNNDVYRILLLISKLKQENNKHAKNKLIEILGTLRTCHENIIGEINNEELKYNKIMYG